MKLLNKVVLEIGCWSFSLGGEHYYGSLHGYKGEEYYNFRLTKKLSQKDATYFNKKNEYRGVGNPYKKGQESESFNTREELIGIALKKYKEFFPEAEVLTLGTFAVCDPQEILDGPKKFILEGNKLWKEYEEIGGYDKGNDEEADKICDKWDELIKKFSK